jgi:phage baseplate assembly protein W
VPVKTPTFRVLGSDLALTRYSGVASSVPLEFADSWGTLDLQVVPGGRGGLPAAANSRDLSAVAGRENLAQALILRLLTGRGALAPLGHPDYGARLVELIGRLNDETTRNLARLYTMEALAQERRVVALLDLAVDTPDGQPDTIRIAFSVQPLDDDQPLALALEIAL